MLEKLKSRKLWAAIAGIVAGLAAAFGLDENTIAQVSGLVMAAASTVAYILGEAKVDAARESAPVIVVDGTEEEAE
jgi:phage shock protein PspC (stress-responsive transcriptional regulator)